MPGRKIELVTGEYYHVYNRSIARAKIFRGEKEYRRFYELLRYYKFLNVDGSFSKAMRKGKMMVPGDTPQISVCSFSIMPNHFHLLLRQEIDGGISRYLGLIQNGYAKYLNLKCKRIGSAFQQRFKAVGVDSDEQALHLTRYIHLNPVVGGVISLDELDDYPWTSLSEYLGRSSDGLIDDSLIRGLFKSNEDLRRFTRAGLNDLLDRAMIKKKLE